VLRVAIAAFKTFSGAFAKLRKASVSFVMSVSVRMEQLDSHWTDFREMWCEDFSKICREIASLIKI